MRGCIFQSRPIVETSGGKLQGYRQRSGFFKWFYAFKGIPYAEPPVGELRFRNPVPHKGWSGVRDASKHGAASLSNSWHGLMKSGAEDCLFLNVYSPNLEAKLAVMFWIQGGAFLTENGDTFVYGPDLLVRENVVVVTLNFRLGILGFLSTGDKHAQGNYGMKDIVMALKWVKTNITAFGGDPERVTVFGMSSGAAAAHMLLLSEMSRGLFQQVILQSGNAFLPCMFRKDARSQAESLGAKLGLKFETTESLVDQLRLIDCRKLLPVQRKRTEMDFPMFLRPFDFVLAVESEDSPEERFLTDEPINLIMKGSFWNVPMIIGTTNNEGLMANRDYLLRIDELKLLNEVDEFMVPTSFEIQNDSKNNEEVAKAFRSFYFKDGKVSSDDLSELFRFISDAMMNFPNERTLNYISEASPHPIYRYKFSYGGALNFVKKVYRATAFKGACHGDDIFYLFVSSAPILAWPWDHAYTVRKRVLRLWTNFAKFSNPTPQTDELIDTLWPKYSQGDGQMLDIGKDLKLISSNDELKIWHDFQKKFTGHS